MGMEAFSTIGFKLSPFDKKLQELVFGKTLNNMNFKDLKEISDFLEKDYGYIYIFETSGREFEQIDLEDIGGGIEDEQLSEDTILIIEIADNTNTDRQPQYIDFDKMVSLRQKLLDSELEPELCFYTRLL